MPETTITRSEDGVLDKTRICDAYELELQSAEGKSVRFGELVAASGGHITTIVVFIRHFFCAYDQEYVHAASQQLTDSILSSLPKPSGPSQLIIIGCGDPNLIVPYVALTSTPFPIYTDPTGRIYETLHMKRTVSNITTPPPYAHVSFSRALGRTLKQMIQTGFRRAFKGGPWNQNGGEWVFRRGKCVYVHKMQHVSDHLTANQLLDILKKEEEVDSSL